VLALAMAIEERETEIISDDELRDIASEVLISPRAVDRALAEHGDELRADPGPIPATWKRWAPFAGVASAAVLNVLLVPSAITALAAPYGLAMLASGAGAMAVREYWRRRSLMRIDRDGIWIGPQVVEWTTVLKLETTVPGTVTLTSPDRSVTLTLRDFGEPADVVALIRARIGWSPPNSAQS
jgi:hypothetical protein